MQVTVRYFGAARAATGVGEEIRTGSAPASVQDVLDWAVAEHGEPLRVVLPRCSFLLGEIAVHGTGSAVADGDCLDVLPPFAGG